MNKYLSLINPVLMVAIGILMYVTIQVWLKPAQETRANYSNAVMDDVVGQNLFRQERKPYTKPIIKKPPPSPAPLPRVAKRKSPVIPPPEYILSGVLLTRTSKIAFMKGEYSEKSDDRQVKKNQIKRKGYEIGETIGQYRITDIQKSSVELTNQQEQTITVQIKKHEPTKLVKKSTSTTTKSAKRKRVRTKPPISKNKSTGSQKITATPTPRPPTQQNILGG